MVGAVGAMRLLNRPASAQLADLDQATSNLVSPTHVLATGGRRVAEDTTGPREGCEPAFLESGKSSLTVRLPSSRAELVACSAVLQPFHLHRSTAEFGLC